NAEQALLRSEQRLRMIADNLPVLIAYVDADECYCFCNRNYQALFSLRGKSVIGMSVRDVLGEDAYALSSDKIKAVLDGTRISFERRTSEGGSLRFWRVDYVPDLEVNGRIPGFYVMVLDITELKLVESRLQDLARHDKLTGLANRHHFEEKLKEAVTRSQRSDEVLALMYLDIDRFKLINDTLGHHGGDQVLREFAKRLIASVRQTDLVARLAGDEFVVLLAGLQSSEEAELVASKIIDCMVTAFEFSGGTRKVTTSIGITLQRKGEYDAEAMLRRADEALYVAKSAGRNNYRLMF
ncbi:MAG: hypothetical protein K0S28_77, partial [Paucimonas sp.]|nr:hypothetical protein [Paucimonas sp.]